MKTNTKFKFLTFLIIALLSLSMVFAIVFSDKDYGGGKYGKGVYGTGEVAVSDGGAGGGGGGGGDAASGRSVTSTFSGSATLRVPEATSVQNSVSEVRLELGCGGDSCQVNAHEVAATSLPSDATNHVVDNNGEILGAVQYTCTGSVSGGSVSYSVSGGNCETLRTSLVHNDGTIEEASVTSCREISGGVSASSSVNGCSYLVVWSASQTGTPVVTGEVVSEEASQDDGTQATVIGEEEADVVAESAGSSTLAVIVVIVVVILVLLGIYLATKKRKRHF